MPKAYPISCLDYSQIGSTIEFVWQDRMRCWRSVGVAYSNAHQKLVTMLKHKAHWKICDSKDLNLGYTAPTNDKWLFAIPLNDTLERPTCIIKLSRDPSTDRTGVYYYPIGQDYIASDSETILDDIIF